MLDLVAGLTAEQLDRRGRMSTGQDGSVADTVDLVARHKHEHCADLEAALSS